MPYQTCGKEEVSCFLKSLLFLSGTIIKRGLIQMLKALTLGLVSAMLSYGLGGTSFSENTLLSASKTEYLYQNVWFQKKKAGFMTESCSVKDVSDGNNNSHLLYVPVNMSLLPGVVRPDYYNSASLKASISVSFEKKQFYSSSSGTYMDTCALDFANCSGTPINGERNYYYTTKYSEGLQYGLNSEGDFSIKGGYSTTYSISKTVTDPVVSYSKQVSYDKVTLIWDFLFKSSETMRDTFNYDVVAFCDVKTFYNQYDSKTGCYISVSGTYTLIGDNHIDVNLFDTVEA